MENKKDLNKQKNMIMFGIMSVVCLVLWLYGINLVNESIEAKSEVYQQPTVFGDIDNKVKTEPYCFNQEVCLDEKYYFVIRDEYYPVSLTNFNKFKTGQTIALSGPNSVTEITIVSEGDDGPIE